MRLLRRVLWSLLVLGVLGSSGIVCSRVAERGRYVGAYSSYGAGPDGTRGLYLLAQRLGASPTRWAQDLAGLPEGGGMLVALGSCGSGMPRALSRYEESELGRWIEQGGTLLVAGARHYLPERLGVRFEREARCREGFEFLPMHDAAQEGELETGDPFGHEADDDVDEQLQEEAAEAELESLLDDDAGDGSAGRPGSVRALADSAQWAVASGPLAGLDWVPLVDPGRLVVDRGVEHEVVLTIDDAPDMPSSPVRRDAGLIARHGRGHVIVLASASPLQNRALLSADGGVLFARLLMAHAPRGPVLFDEYHLGVGERRSMMRYFRQVGLGPLALQLLFVVGLVLLRTGTRFGGIRQPPPPPPAGTASYVAGMGNLFERAGDPEGALAILARQALDRIARHHHVQPSPAARLALTLRERGLSRAAEAVLEIGQLERARRSLEASELPVVVDELDRLVQRASAMTEDAA